MKETINQKVQKDKEERQIIITITKKNEKELVSVSGFPDQLDVALSYLFRAIQAVVQFFMVKALKGEIVDEKRRIIPAHIIPPKNFLN
jgi:excinuclease UvrABC helicase subunit UvrB